jgi:hypothetical protein
VRTRSPPLRPSPQYTLRTSDHARVPRYKDYHTLPRNAQQRIARVQPTEASFQSYYLIWPHDHPYPVFPAYLRRNDNLM